MDPTPFFAYARERQSVLLRRRAGLPKPWTDDSILRTTKFCNVFREDDVTTQWLAREVRARVTGPELLLATVLFRWFNRMTTGEAIFCQKSLDFDWTAFEEFVDILTNTGETNVGVLKSAIVKYCGRGPYVTGAYCIIGAPHMPKLDGILEVFRRFATEPRTFQSEKEGSSHLNWRQVAEEILANPTTTTLESVWDWFRQYDRSGDFMAYEVVTDLANSKNWLDRAPDVMTWANAGPGAIRGLNRLAGRPLTHTPRKGVTLAEMRELLGHSQRECHWPQWHQRLRGFRSSDDIPFASKDRAAWPAWDMRTVEHTLCEFDKYERVRLGQGRVKGAYRGG